MVSLAAELVRVQATHHSLSPFVHNLHQPKLHRLVFIGRDSVECLNSLDPVGDIQDELLALFQPWGNHRLDFCLFLENEAR